MKLEQNGNSYFVRHKKVFDPHLVEEVFVKQSFEFAYEMAYGKGFHRDHRSGGKMNRSDAEIFQNTFQGKIAEIVLYKNLLLQEVNVDLPDFSIHGRGIWDDADLKAAGKSICVKSAAFFSNLLLLETKDWDNEGKYIPNRDNSKAACVYDYFVLVRIKPDIKKLIAESVEDKEILWHEIQKNSWFYDIAGCASLETVQFIIDKKYILPKNALLNNRIKMDAANYYIQANDLQNLEKLYSALKEK